MEATPHSPRPFLARYMSQVLPAKDEGHYDPLLQLWVDGLGRPLVVTSIAATRTQTFVERDPSDPPKTFGLRSEAGTKTGTRTFRDQPESAGCARFPRKTTTFTRVVREGPDPIKPALARASTVTKVVREPADPGMHARARQKVRTLTEVSREPADPQTPPLGLSRCARLGDYSDDLSTGVVAF